MLLDSQSRPLGSLRLSVTDRCNLRCAYCMPEQDYAWLQQGELLRFEELTRLTRLLMTLGLQKVRLTGGEPLARRDLPQLVQQLAALGPRDLALTTNGVLLEGLAGPLKQAGLTSLTVSLDTLQPERFRQLTRRDSHAQVLRGLDAARATGFGTLKLDTVLLRGVNDDELDALLDFAAARDAELRIIEYMDVGGATRWNAAQVVPRAELLSRLAARFGVQPAPVLQRGSAPAERFVLPHGQVFGIIAATTAPFCGACDRLRLSAEGQLLTCLYATKGLDVRALLRGGARDDELLEVLRRLWVRRSDRGAEQRQALFQRGPFRTAAQLQQVPSLEMHRRGG